jgi:hypothetical protein
MKHVKILTLGLLFILCSCKKEKDIPQIDTLFETSFENNNIPDIAGWNLFYDYYSGVQFDTIVSSTCPNGGRWALNIKAQRLHSSHAERYLTNYSGNKFLSLSFYAILNLGQNSATASMSQIRNGVTIKNKEINLGVWNNWAKFTIIDTLNLVPTDSIKIKFKGTGSSYESSDFIIDLVKLEEQ